MSLYVGYKIFSSFISLLFSSSFNCYLNIFTTNIPFTIQKDYIIKLTHWFYLDVWYVAIINTPKTNSPTKIAPKFHNLDIVLEKR